jgi:glutamyl-tRNA synthetase
MTYRGRFAPSPTGALHLGSAATALFCAARARAREGRLVLRIEDLDPALVQPGAREAMLDDLRWLGIAWDEGPGAEEPHAPYAQSQRTRLYEATLDVLASAGHTYLCDCSRTEIARIASAPHAGDEGPRYPGLCRPHGMRPRPFRRPPAVRLAIPEGESGRVTFEDAAWGPMTEHVGEVTGDFVLRRGDGVFAYQLAVVADDIAMGITEVVRGADLLSSTPRQALLCKLLGGTAPRYAHVPLVVGEGGARLAKRVHGVTLESQRAMGRDPAELLRSIASAYGFDLGGASDPVGALVERLDWGRLRDVKAVAVDKLIALPA